ncbi:hypothetical protein [Hwanghaeella sp. LZ110]|uniref:hypothetical protein n=1 Tax=Hwanghaeella sp. LZ110 TaxID=3402810 RepID=UPI003B68549E
MRLYPETDIGRAWLLLILGTILVSGYFSAQWIINNVPFVAFHPACRNYFRVPPQTVDDLHLMSGDLSDEAWDFVRESYGEDLKRFEESGFIKIKNKKVYVQISYYLPDEHLPKYGGEFEESAYLMTQFITYKIFERRQAEGTDFSDFMVSYGKKGKKITVPELMEPDECGFAEELILKGGRFARESSQ